MAEPIWCCCVMVEAANPQGWLHPTSILDVYKVFEHLDMLWMGMLYIPNTWGNTQHMTVKLMPGGVWRWQYTRMAHAPRRWSWISQPTLSSCINQRGTTITSRCSSSITTSVPMAAPKWKHLQVQRTWTYFYLSTVFFLLKLVEACKNLFPAKKECVFGRSCAVCTAFNILFL